MRSGNIDLGGHYEGPPILLGAGYLWGAGKSGYYWATTAQASSNFADRLVFDPTGVYPSYNINRYYGLSLRCLQE